MTRSEKTLLLILPVVVMVLSVSCRKLPPGVLAQVEIDASKGGRVETSDGKLVLEIPANALSINTTVTISETQDSFPPMFRDFVKPLSKCYSIEIGSATLKDSVTLRITCDSMPLAAKSLCYYDDSLPGWVLTGAQVDSANGALSIKTGHLSDWWTVFINEPPISYKRLATPYYEQYENGWCQVASMAMMMKNQGADYEVHEVARDFGFAPEPQFPWGTNLWMYLFTADNVYRGVLGYTTEKVMFVFGQNLLLKSLVGNLIASDRPCMDVSCWSAHAVVITGWSTDSAYFNDPSDYYGYGRLGAASWDQLMDKVGYTGNVIEVFSEPPASAELRSGTLQAVSMVFGAWPNLTYDGRYPRGYYYGDQFSQFPDDPNEDGYDLENMPRTSDSVKHLLLKIANPTAESRDYRFRARLCSRSTGQFVSDLKDTSFAVQPYSRRSIELYNAGHEYLLSQLQPGSYAFRFYLENDGILLDSVDLCFNLADGGGGDYPNRVVASVPVGTSPNGVASLPNGSRVYVTNEASNDVSVIQTSDNTVIATVPVGAHPTLVASLTNGQYVYVACYADNNVSVVRTSDNMVIATIPVGESPCGVAALPSGDYVYVSNCVADNVSVVQTANNTEVATLPVGDHPYAVTARSTGDYVYVTNRGDDNVSKIRTSDNTVVATIPVGDSPWDMAVLLSDDYVYVTNWGSNDVSVIRTSDNTVVATVTVGDQPRGIAALPDGKYVYVANCGSSDVSVIRTSDNSVVATLPVGTEPYGVVTLPNGTHVYVANRSGCVSVIGF